MQYEDEIDFSTNFARLEEVPIERNEAVSFSVNMQPDLEAQMKAIIVMQDEVSALKSQNDANTTNLSKTIETCKK